MFPFYAVSSTIKQRYVHKSSIIRDAGNRDLVEPSREVKRLASPIPIGAELRGIKPRRE
ncbi:MAG: hypothetical protein NTY91_07465 [Euryarchaeota archaeon]|nr:hypothetical protein [Euryarchaeota archaeon]